MREIKFRAWDKQLNKMFPENGVIAKLEFGANCELSLIGVAEQVQINEDGDIDWDLFEVSNLTNDLILMQYTGLKDKNGVEIYEGDIIKYIYEPLGANPKVIQYYYIGEVVFPFYCRWVIDGSKILNEKLKLSHHKNKEETYYHSTAGKNWIDKNVNFKRCEIIGNIYENKNLLEK